MQFTFDPRKDQLNIRHHGISLARAGDLEWSLLWSFEDDSRHDYYELRMKGFAPIGAKVYCIVFIERDDDVIHAISLRRATPKEVRDYVNHQD